MVAGMGEAGAQLLGRGRRLHLFLHASTLIGQLDNELCHAYARRRNRPAFPGESLDSGYQLPPPDLGAAPLNESRRTRKKQRSKNWKTAGLLEQAAEELDPEGGGGFNPRIKPTESMPALAAAGRFSANFIQDSEFFRRLVKPIYARSRRMAESVCCIRRRQAE